MTNKILFVDDDSNILESYKRFHRRKFNIETAIGGEAGLARIVTHGPFAVIVSDLRMPQIDGVQFLAEAKEIAPDSVRMLLTGQADLKDAIAVVNEGHIFRFLTKPCDPEVFAKALHDGIDQYRLITSEKELLNKTLKGSVKLLVDIMSILSPDTISRSIRIRRLASKVASRLDVKELWKVDVAALLSQIGCVTIPMEILVKKCQGQALSENENEIFIEHPEVGKNLLANIPRLEDVAEAIAYQEKHFDGDGAPNDLRRGKDIPFIARILKILLDFDEIVVTGRSEEEALAELKSRNGWYDPDVLSALQAELLKADEGFVVKEVKAKDVHAGMILADDLKTKTNLLLLPRRHEISETLRICVLNFAQKDNIIEPIKILEKVKVVDGKKIPEPLETEI